MISFTTGTATCPRPRRKSGANRPTCSKARDWYNAGYIIARGSNLPQTRTPDAHFFTEARYRGTKIAAVSPDYADFTKFADHWLTVKPGTDAALGMAMTHVVFKEYFLDRRVPYFEDYARRFTDLCPCLCPPGRRGQSAYSRPLRARFGHRARGQQPNGKTVVYDVTRNGPAVPMGSVGARYGEDGRWNLHMRDEADEAELTPLLRMEEAPGAQWTMAAFPVFDAGKPSVKLRPRAVRHLADGRGPAPRDHGL